MAVWVIIAFWVVVGLGVLVFAMASTRRRSEERRSRVADRATTLGFTVFFLGLGVLVPTAIMFGNSDAEEKARGGIELTAEQTNGRQLFNERCSTCHTLAASNAVGMVGPDLDKLRPPAELTVNAIEDGRARGQGQMPAGLLSGQDAEAVASYVAAVAGQ